MKIKGNLIANSIKSNNRNITSSLNKSELFDKNGNMILDSYTNDEIQDIIGILPLSHYGTFSYLPVGVAGTFEGPSDVPEYRYRKLQLENDGTLTMLRSGTNGAKRGLYYSYMTNALSTDEMNSTINTTKEYKPTFLNNYTQKMAFSSDSKIVSGISYDENNNEYIFVSWCYDTLDDSKHIGKVFLPDLILDQGTSINDIRFVMTGIDDIFFFIEYYKNNGIYLIMKSIKISSILNENETITVINYTNWSNNTFYNQTLTDDNIILNNLIGSSNISDKPYVLYPETMTQFIAYMTGSDIYAVQNYDGNIRIRVVGDMWFSTASSGIRPKHSYSIMVNPQNKTANLEDYISNSPGITITQSTNTEELKYTGFTATYDPILTNNTNRGNLVMSYFYMNDGNIFACGTGNIGSAPSTIQKAFYENSSSIYDIIRVRQYPLSTEWKSGNIFSTFGSPVGSEVSGFEWLPNNRYKVCSYDGKYNTTASVNECGETPTFQFDSVSFGKLYGFGPTTNRFFVNYNLTNRIFITSISGSNVQTNGGILIENFRTQTPLNYDENLNYNGSISIDNDMLTTLKNSRLDASTINVNKNNTNVITLYVPQQPDIPCFALVSGVTDTLENYIQVFEVNTNARNGNITQLTFKKLIYEGSGNFNSLSTHADFGIGPTSTGITIYDAGDFYFIGGVDPYMFRTQGDTNSTTWMGTIDKSTSSFDSFKIMGVYQVHTSDYSLQPFAVPNVGFGYINYISDAKDDRVRIIFQPTGKTKTDYNNWKNVGDQIILGSQDVADEFVVYFTENTPLFISGKYFIMNADSIDLFKIKQNPQNTIFNVYVVLNEGIPSYLISETIISESNNTMWIGTVETDDNNITEINLNKRTRLDLYGLSIDPAGSSIPVSTGEPSSNGTIKW